MSAVMYQWVRAGLWSVWLGAVAGAALAQAVEPMGETAQDAVSEDAAVAGEPAGDVPATRYTHWEPRQALTEALRAQLPEFQQRWLQDSQGDFLALYHPNNLPQPMGAVLIVHDLGQHPDWPRIVRSLRLGLPDHGWHTLSIMLPAAPDQEVPERVLGARATAEPTAPDVAAPTPPEATPQESPAPGEAADAAQNDAADEATIELQESLAESGSERSPGFETLALERIQAGLDHLQGMGLANLVIVGVGDSARLASLFLARHPQYRAEKGMTLVWVDPRLEPVERADLRQLFGEPPYPRMLDVADSSVPERRAYAKERLRSARRLRLENYVQINLPLRGGDTARQDAALLHRLRGWLEVNAPGEERRGQRGPAGP